jgi:hypothetical protein
MIIQKYFAGCPLEEVQHRQLQNDPGAGLKTKRQVNCLYSSDEGQVPN